MRVLRGFLVIFVSTLVFFTASIGFAQSEQGQNGRMFGQGQPASVQDLPPGQLKNRLEGLPAKSRGKALKWLQEFSFPEADLQVIQIDNEGNVFYGDTHLPDPALIDSAETSGPTLPEAAPQATLDGAFELHSKPGAPNVVYIDFDGATITGTAWNGTHSTLEAVPFNPSVDAGQSDAVECNNPNIFCDRERVAIVDIWHRVAEDLAPYNIDVTTERPNSFNSNTGTILVTNSVDAFGNVINCSSCGGVAYVGVFGNSNYHTYYSPALVFYNKLGNGGSSYTAEASSHEFGHNLGLSHDGASGVSYYGGQGSGLVSWAPIMGNSYNNNVTQWSKGEYAGANQTQNDLSIIDTKLGYDSDDHGNSSGSATALVIGGSGQVVSSNPELDPQNLITENKGIINSSSDVDVFSFQAAAGLVSLTVTPAWDAFYRSSSRRGANLDVQAQLQDSNGNPLLTNDPADDTKATISTNVTGGTYHLSITGVGNGVANVSGYSDYNSMGQYFINGSVVLAAADNTAPTPNPMSWSGLPGATGLSSIAMTASLATDETSSVEYRFNCTSTNGNSAPCTAADSGWQASRNYSATGLQDSTSYTFLTRARDQAGNETAASNPESAITDTPPPPTPPATPTGFTAMGVSASVINLNWTDAANNETGYRVERSDDGANIYSTIVNLGVDASAYSDSDLPAGTTYDYRVFAVNSLDSAPALATGTTDELPPYVDYTAASQSLVSGSVSGSLSSTYSENGSAQSITERESGGKKNRRYSYLEHRWNFNISVGATVTVYAVARSGGSSEGDTFDFQYSLDGGSSFVSAELFNVSSTSYALYSAAIPAAPSGSIVIRVIDTDRTAGNRNLDRVDVDHLFIQVGSPSIDPPIGDPGNLTAVAASSTSIDLEWVDGTENETGFLVEHSLTGAVNDWTERASLPAGSNSYTDNGLTDQTLYYYRVHAFNNNGVSASIFANATTLITPDVTLSLEASGRKQKGVKHIDLTWSGSNLVDIYRNGGAQPIADGVSGSTYDDDTNSKGGGTYTHTVCVAGTNTCSNTTTTIF